MLKKILTLFKSTKPTAVSTSTHSDDQLAVAALLIEAARADEDYSEMEQEIVERALKTQFDLSPDAASALRLIGEQAQSAANDLHQFTKTVKSFDEAEKIRLVETLWKIVLSDGARDKYEDSLIRRICGLIYLDDRQSGEARLRVAGKNSGTA